MRSARHIGASDALFVPPLVSLQHNRLLKSQAREVLVSYGEPVLDALGYFLRDQEEDIWVRRHIPGTLACIPCQKSMDLLVSTLEDRDGFLRFKVMTAIEKMRRERPEFTFNREPIETLALQEAGRYATCLSIQSILLQNDSAAGQTLLGRALIEKSERTIDRIYRLLGLLYSWKDVAAARWAMYHGDARARSSAAEVLDNLLKGNLRKRILPLLEDMPLQEKLRRTDGFIQARPQTVQEMLAQLIDDPDQVIASAAIHTLNKSKCGRLRANSSVRCNSATPGIGTFSRPHRGLLPPIGCPLKNGAPYGRNRCPQSSRESLAPHTSI